MKNATTTRGALDLPTTPLKTIHITEGSCTVRPFLTSAGYTQHRMETIEAAASRNAERFAAKYGAATVRRECWGQGQVDWYVDVYATAVAS